MVIVPRKSAKTRVTPVEQMEGRPTAKRESGARNAPPTQSGTGAPTQLHRIGERARKKPSEKWTNLMSHMKVPLLRQAYERLKRSAAPGVDDETWSEFGERLDERLVDLESRIHRGSYHPKPVLRVHIPKGDGRTRPLGLPALEDKVVQMAAKMVLEPVYEAEFLGFSYGFRPRRSPHEALDALAEAIGRKVTWILDADIQSFYDTLDHGWLQRFIEHRIGDRRMVRLLMKWAKAGVVEAGRLHEVEEGTPQGGIISPLLANVFLHYVFDLWVVSWRKKRAHGEVYVVRYADDFAMGFEREQDAKAFHEDLRVRMERFGLKLHPDKTRVIQFGRRALDERKRRGLGKSETFDFLGFTHYIGRSRGGKAMLKRQTSRKKRLAKLRSLKEEMRKRRHEPARDQYTWICQVLAGHYRYYGVPTNARGLTRFRASVEWMWHRSLQRRSQRGRWTKRRLESFEARFPMPEVRILHPWPDRRFAERHAKRQPLR